MPTPVTCPSCGSSFVIPSDMATELPACPTCGANMVKIPPKPKLGTAPPEANAMQSVSIARSPSGPVKASINETRSYKGPLLWMSIGSVLTGVPLLIVLVVFSMRNNDQPAAPQVYVTRLPQPADAAAIQEMEPAGASKY